MQHTEYVLDELEDYAYELVTQYDGGSEIIQSKKAVSASYWIGPIDYVIIEAKLDGDDSIVKVTDDFRGLQEAIVWKGNEHGAVSKLSEEMLIADFEIKDELKQSIETQLTEKANELGIHNPSFNITINEFLTYTRFNTVQARYYVDEIRLLDPVERVLFKENIDNILSWMSMW